LSSITDPYLNVFRGLIPPLGGLDLSALVAFFALQIGGGLLSQLAMSTAPSFSSFQ
jgi:YggT family protein